MAALLAERWPEAWRTLTSHVGADFAELARWRDVAARLVNGLDPATERIEQFKGYSGLEDIDLEQYVGRTVPMDVVLGRERTQASQVAKQADVVMLLALLPQRFDPRVHETNFRYYEPRTATAVPRAGLCTPSSPPGSVTRNWRSAISERRPRRTSKTLPPVAPGECASRRSGDCGRAAILGFAGLGLMDDGLRFEPRLPREWNTLSFRVQWRGRQVEVSLDGVRHRLSATLETGAHMRLYLGSQVHALDPGQVWESSWDEPLLIRELHAAA